MSLVKRIGLAIGLMIILAGILVPTPASSAPTVRKDPSTTQLLCTYTGGATPVNSAYGYTDNILVSDGMGHLIPSLTHFHSSISMNDGHARTWNWTTVHNGANQGAGSNIYGSFNSSPTTHLQLTGTDWITFHVWSTNGKVDCFGIGTW